MVAVTPRRRALRAAYAPATMSPIRCHDNAHERHILALLRRLMFYFSRLLLSRVTLCYEFAAVATRQHLLFSLRVIRGVAY